MDAVLAAEQRELLRACVPDVARDVQQIHRDPRHGDRGGVALPGSGEIRDECRWYDDLEERSAENGHGLAEGGEHEVSGFVDGEIQIIERVPVLRIPEPRDGVNRDEDESCDPNARP